MQVQMHENLATVHKAIHVRTECLRFTWALNTSFAYQLQMQHYASRMPAFRVVCGCSPTHQKHGVTKYKEDSEVERNRA